MPKAGVTWSQKKEDAEADRVLQDASKEEGEDTKREEDDEGKKKNDEVLIPKTKSQLAREAKREIPPASPKEAPLMAACLRSFYGGWIFELQWGPSMVIFHHGDTMDDKGEEVRGWCNPTP